MNSSIQLRRVLAFDRLLYVDDKSTPLDYTMRQATVVAQGFEDQFGRPIVSLVFDHRPNQVSNGHFVDGLVRLHDID